MKSSEMSGLFDQDNIHDGVSAIRATIILYAYD